MARLSIALFGYAALCSTYVSANSQPPVGLRPSLRQISMRTVHDSRSGSVAKPNSALVASASSSNHSAAESALSAHHTIQIPSGLHTGTGAISDGSKQQPPVPGNQYTSPSNVVIKPQIYFLFLVYVKINNEEVWDRFFDSAPSTIDYVALVHCKSEASCRSNIKSRHRFFIIPSVQTQYCFDLVSGMNALLRAALARGGPVGSPYDKFVFVSDSTLPVKPFPVVQRLLTSDDMSDFCIFPRNEWAEVSESFPTATGAHTATRVAVKHHQWVVLSRKHAEISVQKSGALHDIMTSFQLNQGFRNTGCLDEFWHFMTLYNALDLSGRPTLVHLGRFRGEPLNTANYEIQGRCDTFVHWVPRASGIDNNMTELAGTLSNDPGTDMVPASETRPASISRLSRSALAALRRSPFLFVRKVDENTVFSGCGSLAEAFKGLVFSDIPSTPPGTDTVWKGQGTWLDNRLSRVTISSLDGSLRLLGAGRGMEAKGYYCGNTVQVIFTNDYRASAELSEDGNRLQWNNGVIWSRAPGNTVR